MGEKIPETPLLVVAGGDGTINYAVNNINLKQTKLLILPLGRGNVLANALNINLKFPLDLNDNLDEIEIPLLEVNNRLAVFGAGLGESGRLMLYSNPYSQFGISSYFITGLMAITHSDLFNVKVNNVTYTDLLTIETSLWGTSAWGLPLTNLPSSKGPFLVLVKGIPLNTAISFLTGHLPEGEGVTTIEGKKFDIESEREVFAHIDGEALITKRFNINLSTKKATILKY